MSETAFLAELENEILLSPDQVAARWNVHRTTIMRLFRDEPGVVKLSTKTGRNRRTTMRIPVSVLEKVRRRNEVV